MGRVNVHVLKTVRLSPELVPANVNPLAFATGDPDIGKINDPRSKLP
jgi:hypothetical protein